MHVHFVQMCGKFLPESVNVTTRMPMARCPGWEQAYDGAYSPLGEV